MEEFKKIPEEIVMKKSNSKAKNKLLSLIVNPIKWLYSRTLSAKGMGEININKKCKDLDFFDINKRTVTRNGKNDGWSKILFSSLSIR